MPPDTENVCFWGKTGSDLPTVKTSLLTPSRHKREDFAATHKLIGERPG